MKPDTMEASPFHYLGGPMIISLVNRSKVIDDKEMQRVVRAINRQITEDFTPYWSFGAMVRLEGAVGKRMNKQALPDMRGDAVMYVVDGRDKEEAEGYHDTNFRDVPCGYVFLDVCKEQEDPWTVALSHEVLEQIGDPMGNLLVQGPHPVHRDRKVFHLFEMCDAVQCEYYDIDGVQLSNFVLPSYFTPGEQEGRRNDFLNIAHPVEGKRTKATLKSFGVNPGGYLNYLNPLNNKWESPTFDAIGAKRKKVKAAAGIGRAFRRTHE